MTNFNRDNRSGERRSFDRRGGDREMFKATCASCGKICEVPFRPKGDRPVYCSDCFESHSGSDSRRPGRSDSRRSDYGDRKMFEAVCDSCGTRCSVPFQPTSGKPVYCNNCFGKNNSSAPRNPEQYKKQFEMLNAKLDKIIKILVPAVSEPVEPIVEETEKVEKVEKPKKKTKSKKATS